MQYNIHVEALLNPFTFFVFFLLAGSFFISLGKAENYMKNFIGLIAGDSIITLIMIYGMSLA